MKVKISNYTFNAATQTVIFNDYSNGGITLDSILLITNTTSNIIIYNFANPILGGTVSGNVLTLTYNTSIMGNTDRLLIYYDDNSIQSRDATLQLLMNQNDLLRRAVKVLESQGSVDSSNRQRVNIDAASSFVTVQGGGNTLGVTGFGTVPTIQNNVGSPYGLVTGTPVFTFEGPVGQEWRVADSARNTFANGIRPQIR